jgi:hypothetical protein
LGLIKLSIGYEDKVVIKEFSIEIEDEHFILVPSLRSIIFPPFILIDLHDMSEKGKTIQPPELSLLKLISIVGNL